MKLSQRAFRQYEQAMGAAANMADRMSQMEAMDGAARCLESLRLQVSSIKIVFIVQCLKIHESFRTKFVAVDRWSSILDCWKFATQSAQR